MRHRAGSRAFAFLLLCATAGALHGQETSDPGRFTLAFTAGRHLLGIEAGVSPVPGLALIGLAEGGLDRAVRGAGIRFDVYVERSGRVYTHAIFGSMHCVTPWDVATCSTEEEERRGAWYPGGGIELRLRDDGVVWLGLDAGRWIAFDRDAVGRAVEHFTAAAVLRLRW